MTDECHFDFIVDESFLHFSGAQFVNVLYVQVYLKHGMCVHDIIISVLLIFYLIRYFIDVFDFFFFG